MSLPPINVGDIRRMNSMPNLAPPERLAPRDNPQQPEGPQGPVAPPDPVINGAVVNGVGPDLQSGGGQAQNFAANHNIAFGRDWDLTSAKGVLQTAQEAIKNIKTVIGGKQKFEVFNNTLNDAFRQAMEAHNANPMGDIAALGQSFADVKQIVEELKTARAALTAAIKDGSGKENPRDGIAEVRKTLRVFRYEMQRELAKRGSAVGNMDLYEGALREIQHAFTFGVGSKVKETFARVMELERALDHAFTQFSNRLNAVNPASQPPVMPADIKLANAAGEALNLSHLTNDRIRDFQDMDATSSTLRGIVGPLAEKGGSRKVEFTMGAGALIGLGFSKAFTAGVRAGARFRVVGEIDAPGKGRPISVTFRISLGAEVKGGIKAGDESFSPDAKAEASAGLEGSHFTTRTYQTVDDLILDANRCKLATSRTIGGAIVGGAKALGFSIYKLGRSFFRWLGRKSGEVKQDNAAYLQSLKERGIAGALDRLLAKRANPVIVAERKGWTVRGQAEAGVSASAMKDVLDIGLSGNIAREKDYKVVSRAYASIARAARNAPDIEALHALMRPGPEGGLAGPVPHYSGMSSNDVFRSIETQFDEAIREGEEVSKRKIGILRSPDKVGMARVANTLRTLILATELAVREGKISREAADTLLERYSNPSFTLPPDIFREYMMTDIGAAKPAKIRNSASLKLKVGLFTGWSNDLTSDVSSSVVKAVADGAVKEMRHQIGLDTTFEYRFSSEKPVKPGSDPRPWENTVKTTHELAITASTPMRVIIDAITRTVVNKGERLENKSESVAKDTIKGVAKDLAKDIPLGTVNSTIVGLLLASVKETAVAAVKNWLSKPENIEKLLLFIIDHAEEAFNTILDVVQWACEHPEATKLILGTIKGTSLVSEAERAKVLKWTFVDGELDTVAVSSEVSSKLGVNVDPVGVAVGVGFDFSYSVKESVKERDITPHPTLTMLLGKGEEFLFGETGIEKPGSGQPFKSWLSRNAMGVEHMIDNLMTDENRQKTLRLYLNAQTAAEGDLALQQRLQDAWQRVQNLGDDATLDAKVDAAHEFITTMVLAYRSPGAASVAA